MPGSDLPIRPVVRTAAGSEGRQASREHLADEPEEAEELSDDLGPEADEDGESKSAESDDFAQPAGEDGVTEDMSTLALNPTNLEGLADAEARQAGLHTNGNFGELDDAAIMLELKAGNMAAFDFLMVKYRKPIIHFMFRMTHNQAVAEELAQEVFLRVYRSRETYRAEARFSTWLYRIATNLGVNHARDTRHERSAATVYLDEPDSETGTSPDVADSTPGAEAGILRRERMEAIRAHVISLPERQQMAVLMHKYEGMDYKQIGEVLKLSESATKSLLFRAYQTLRDKLKDFV
ncbi:RNA polymerase sigma factor [Granulicella tundricola]|uniref:RNA polymerase sigma factor n=1 Tax=Granulicella tundricola (strain ATCC BAA-1859 / DSM 23138 / MP5ACTX9) TaxID=1198114 RepID=E8WWE4_GRATM|nr:sigma-70 family RNA polymerase sigma factor [Granulicella tundricola]ADW69608.1 RNA polymerase, sigma-24 subunit, ECF subfamily [Granulicella tundricola MP5ACTX9]